MAMSQLCIAVIAVFKGDIKRQVYAYYVNSDLVFCYISFNATSYNLDFLICVLCGLHTYISVYPDID